MTIDRRLRAARPDEGHLEALINVVGSVASSNGAAIGFYREWASPLGALTLVATKRGLARVHYGHVDDVLQRVADDITPSLVRAPTAFEEVVRQLDEYFSGHRRRFQIRLDWSRMTGFRREVLRATARIPWGRVLSYREVARRAGNERATRAAGNALGSNPLPIVVPCHRVLRTGGGLGGYTGGLEKKEFLLGLEGVVP